MIVTALTEMFGLQHPVVLAPMGSVAGGSLAAAVSNAGGLGLVGGGYGDPAFLRAELARVREATQRPWGVGFITWSMRPETLTLALDARPQAVMLSFGDPRPHAEAIKAAGCRLICQVQDVRDAVAAREAGADLIVAQGTEAGGHGAMRATLPLVPAVVDAVAPLPVVAAGGIADGRGLAAALMLGAQGALIGTRFYAASESLASAEAKARIVAAEARQTERTRVFDVVRGYDWPSPYTGRALRNAFTARWQGREDALAAALASEQPRYWRAAQDGDHDTAVVWAGEAVDLIGEV
ncbi:MAG: NAD(P)H-dependent flavin oxidoreductase, partial [Gammaproteobacteria bacterium]